MKHYRVSTATDIRIGHIVIDDQGRGHLVVSDDYTIRVGKPLYVTEELPEEESDE